LREEIEHTFLLYKVQSFYVEVYYNNESNKIARFNPFQSKKRLELYFDMQQNGIGFLPSVSRDFLSISKWPHLFPQRLVKGQYSVSGPVVKYFTV
jgi:hypothetical protein